MKERIVGRLDMDDTSAARQAWRVEYQAEYETPTGKGQTFEGEGWSHLNVEEAILFLEDSNQGVAARRARQWAADSGFKPGPARVLSHGTGFEMKLTRP